MKLSSFLLDVFFPRFCTSCGKINTFLCQNCYEKIHFLSIPVAAEVDPYYLDDLIAAAHYEDVVKSLIKSLKYQSIKDVGKTLARMIYYSTSFPQSNLVTAVPLHKKRQRQRGFNQAEIIARELSVLDGTPYQTLLKRVKHQKHQASIKDKEKRLTHLRQSFAVISNKIDQLRNSTVLLIDDVTTTGSTLNECARILKESGVSKVFGLVVAHGG